MKPIERTVRTDKICRHGIFSATLAFGLAWSAWAEVPFTVNGNGTVTDATTSLVWDQCVLGRTGSDCLTNTATERLYNWPEALLAAFAANAASYKGFTDWRVPNVNELASISKLDAVDPAIDTTAFPNTPITGDTYNSGGSWTSTNLASQPRYAYGVDFNDGDANEILKNTLNYVRLVRSGQPYAFFDGLPPDNTPPITTAGPSISSGPTQTTAGLSVTIDEAGTGYWLLVPNAAADPTPAQVVARVNYDGVTLVDSGSSPMTAASPVVINLTGLTASTTYKLHFVAKDAANNLQAAVGSTTVTTIAIADTTPPLTTTGPTVSSGPTQTTAGVSVTINEAGTGYWLLVPSAAAAPTPAQVEARVNYDGVTLVASGSTPMTAATPVVINLTGLTAGTTYKLYFVAKDAAGNQQAAVSSATVTTAEVVADTTPPLTTAGPSVSSGPGGKTAGISVTINEAGTGYWLLVPSAATAPTAAQVEDRANYSGVTLVGSGSITMAAATPTSISLSGLTASTAYKLYFVAKDAANNRQASPTAVALTTKAGAGNDLTPILMLLLD